MRGRSRSRGVVRATVRQACNLINSLLLKMANKTLEGVVVLDLSSYLAGPYGATLLGDLGAEVIKVEPPGGDMMRHYPSTLTEESRAFLGSNRNKRSIVIDLKQPRGLEVLQRLVAKADVLLHNFRPGVPEKLGIDPASLQKIRPNIVTCALTGFGQTGPLKDLPGFDQVLQCYSGVAEFQGLGEDAPRIVWGSIIDYYSASLLAMAISAALYRREISGEAQEVDVSLLRSALALQAGRMVWADSEERDTPRDLRSGRLTGIHPTREGFLYFQAQTPPFWTALCECLELPELAQNPRYDDMRKRKALDHELVPIVRKVLATRTALEWGKILAGRVPSSVVQPMENLFDDPQVEALGLIVEHDHPKVGRYRAATHPVQINDPADNVPDRRAPLLGEHTDELLREVGFSDADVQALRQLKSVH